MWLKDPFWSVEKERSRRFSFITVKLEKKSSKESVKAPSRRKTHPNRRKEEKGLPGTGNKRPRSPAGANAYDADESDSDDVPISYQQVSEKVGLL